MYKRQKKCSDLRIWKMARKLNWTILVSVLFVLMYLYSNLDQHADRNGTTGNT